MCVALKHVLNYRGYSQSPLGEYPHLTHILRSLI